MKSDPLLNCLGKGAFSLVCLLGSSLASWAGTVIANKDLDLKPGDVSNLFVGDTEIVNGVKVQLVDNTSAKDAFGAWLSGSAGAYAKKRATKSFRNGNPAVEKGTDAEVIQFVKTTPGGVGYLIESAPADVQSVKSF